MYTTQDIMAISVETNVYNCKQNGYSTNQGDGWFLIQIIIDLGAKPENYLPFFSFFLLRK